MRIPTSRRATPVLLGLALFVAVVTVPGLSDATTSSGDRAIFEPLAPVRILDTRFGPSPLPNGTKVGPGQTIELTVKNVGGVADDATAAVLNLTISGATAASHLAVWPTGQAMPTTSNINFTSNQTLSNLATVKLGTDGKVSIFNNAGNTHVIIDVNGYYRAHDHDDRYYTKAQTNAKLAAADYVTNTQIKDAEVKAAEIAPGAVTRSELTKVNTMHTITGQAQTVPAGGCKSIGSFSNGAATLGDWILFSIDTVEAGNYADITFPVQRSRNGGANIIACNGGTTNKTFDLGKKIEVLVIAG